MSRARSTEPDRLKRQLRGDLDAIVLTALRKEPAQRYASAEAFLDDIQRYLALLPVAARKKSTWYKTQKFIHRNRVSLSAFVIAMSLLLGMNLYYTNAVTQERDQAIQEQQKAEQVTTFLVDLFRGLDPTEAVQDTVTAPRTFKTWYRPTTNPWSRPTTEGQATCRPGRSISWSRPI